MLSCECIAIVVDDSYFPVDINTMSVVPEHPDFYGEVEVSDVLTNPISGMELDDSVD